MIPTDLDKLAEEWMTAKWTFRGVGPMDAFKAGYQAAASHYDATPSGEKILELQREIAALEALVDQWVPSASRDLHYGERFSSDYTKMKLANEALEKRVERLRTVMKEITATERFYTIEQICHGLREALKQDEDKSE